jgi:hypothetical protein
VPKNAGRIGPTATRIGGGVWALSQQYQLQRDNRWKVITNATGGTITTSGGYRYHTFDYSSSTQTFVPDGVGTVEVFAWGAGGAAGGTGSGSAFCYGGGGGYAFSTLEVSEGTSYSIAPGQGGQLGTQGCVTGSGGAGGTNPLGYGNGGAGSAAGTTPCSGTGGGGGAGSFVALGATILVAAGGGGGGGGTESAENGSGKGGGGGQNGTAGNGSGASGGTAGASGSTNGQNASVIGGDHSGSGGGGGGLLGGTAGINPSNDAVSGGGGGGGTSLGTTTEAGNGQTPAQNSNTLRGTAGTGGNIGQAGGNGRIVIRYQV